MQKFSIKTNRFAVSVISEIHTKEYVGLKNVLRETPSVNFELEEAEIVATQMRKRLPECLISVEPVILKVNETQLANHMCDFYNTRVTAWGVDDEDALESVDTLEAYVWTPRRFSEVIASLADSEVRTLEEWAELFCHFVSQKVTKHKYQSSFFKIYFDAN